MFFEYFFGAVCQISYWSGKGVEQARALLGETSLPNIFVFNIDGFKIANSTQSLTFMAENASFSFIKIEIRDVAFNDVPGVNYLIALSPSFKAVQFQ